MHDIEYIIGAPQYDGYTWKCDCGAMGETLQYDDAMANVRAHVTDNNNR